MIRTRLTVWNCAVLALVLAAVGASIDLTTRAAVFRAIDDGLRNRASNFETGGDHPPGPPPPPRPDERAGPGQMPPPLDPAQARSQGIDPRQARRLRAMDEALRPMIIGLDGRDPVQRGRAPWTLSGFREALGGAENFRAAAYAGEPLRVLSSPLRRDGRVVAVVQLAAPIGYQLDSIRRLDRTLFLVFPLAVAAMLLAGVTLTRRALRPVGEIAEAADRIGADRLQERLPVRGDDEFARLGRTFNAMLERLQSAFDRQRRFTADASHELKSPLTAIRARTGVALAGPDDPAALRAHLQAIERAAELMSTVVHDLLLLAASDEGRLRLRKERALLAGLAEDAVASVDLGGRTVAVHVPPDLELEVDPSATTRVLVNLLQNAVEHTRVSESIEVAASADEGEVRIRVRDHGAGIPPQHVERVFDRFHRIEEARDRASGGTGLGLAIAKAIVEAHGGTIRLESVVGAGTTVEVSLPRST